MMRRLCQGLLLSGILLGLIVPAAGHTLVAQTSSEMPCPDVDMTRHCPDGVSLDCLAGCMVATPALSSTARLSPAALPQWLPLMRVAAPDIGYRRLLERPPSRSV